jgi:hypothetical protein
MQSATATAGLELKLEFSLLTCRMSGPWSPSLSPDPTEVSSNGRLMSVPITYDPACHKAGKYFPSPHPKSATIEATGRALRKQVAPGQSTPLLPLV